MAINLTKEQQDAIDQRFKEIEVEIRNLSDAFKKIRDGGLAERTICLLLNDRTGIPLSHIAKILKEAPDLATHYLKKAKRES